MYGDPRPCWVDVGNRLVVRHVQSDPSLVRPGRRPCPRSPGAGRQRGEPTMPTSHALSPVMRTITCPAEITVVISAKGGATFAAKCRGCALRQRCTTARNGLRLTIHRHDDELTAARMQWRGGDGLGDYRQRRPMVERIAWLVAKGNRRVRFREVTRTSSASPCAWPPCGWSTSVPTTTEGRCSAAPNQARKPGSSKRDHFSGYAHLGDRPQPFSRRRFGQTYPELAIPNIRRE